MPSTSEVAAPLPGPSTRGVELYTRQTLYWALVALALTGVLGVAPTRDGGVVAVVAVLVGGLALITGATTAYWLNRLTMPSPLREARPPLLGTVVAVVLAATLSWWVGRHADPSLFVTYTSAAFAVIAASWTPALRLRQMIPVAVAALVLTACSWLIGGLPSRMLTGSVIGVVLMIGAMMGTFASSSWILRVTIELDRARGTAARLAVAEERLRFSRDLHDVFGRTLAAVSLKTQLAAGLVAKGRSDEAQAELSQVRDTVDEATQQLRAVAHGYRRSDLGEELRGARSLLASAGIACTVTGADEVPSAPAEFGWIVREAVTNILRHSAARTVQIDLADDRRSPEMATRTGGITITISNDGVPRDDHDSTPGNGLSGLQERMAVLGGTLEVGRENADFTVRGWLPLTPGRSERR